MKTIVYMLFFLLVSLASPAQEVLSTFHGMVSIKANKIELKENVLVFDLNIDLCGLSVGRYQTLSLIPILRSEGMSTSLQPIIINGANKHKMYERTLAFKGKAIADEGAYVVIKNDPSAIRQISYKVTCPYQSWMKGARFVLHGQFNNYDGIAEQICMDVLTENLSF